MKHISQFKLWPRSDKKVTRSDSPANVNESSLDRLRHLTRAEIARDPGSVIPSRENLVKLFNDLNTN